MTTAERPSCPWCGKPADRECDGPIAAAEDRRDLEQTTCSSPVCSGCSTHLQPERLISGFVCSRGRGGRCERFDNRGDLCPFCSGRQGELPLTRAEHDQQLASHVRAARPAFVIAAVTGGRYYWPSLAELQRMVAEGLRRGVTDWRDGDCPTGLDRIARGFVRARGVGEVEKHPANWKRHGKAGGHIRNGTMLDGTTPGVTSRTAGLPVQVLFRFRGNVGTANCGEQAERRGIEVVTLEPIAEPRPWNMYHRWSADQPTPPGLIYVGRSRRHGGPHPLANQFRVEFRPGEDRAAAAPRILGEYRRWLWARLQAGDRAVLEALDAIQPDSYLGCTCWPLHCHVEIIIRAWRWRQLELAKGTTP